MKDKSIKSTGSLKELLLKVKKLEKDFVDELNNSKSEGQKKKKKMKDIRKEIARVKTTIMQNIYEKGSNE